MRDSVILLNLYNNMMQQIDKTVLVFLLHFFSATCRLH